MMSDKPRCAVLCWLQVTQRINPAADANAAIGLVERYQVLTEGQCFSVVTIYLPASIDDMMTPREKFPLIVWYSSSVASASAPPAQATKWAQTGHAVAVVELCGFGSTGPVPSGGG